MDIAVLFGEVGYISHKNMMDGITSLASKKGINTFLFTCEGWKYCENLSYEEGEYNIYSLPDLSRFDGVIVDLDSIHDDKARSTVIKKIKESKIPSVSINLKIDAENSAVIELENNSGISKIVDHLVKEHGVKSFHYISGPMNNRDAVERKAAFLRSMKEYKIKIEPTDISYGDFQYHSGQKVIERYLKKNSKLPEAFVAANDYMAIGAMKALQKAGYVVPEDVIVTGYDDCLMAGYVQPRLTTIVRNEFKAGKDAIKTLERLIDGTAIDKRIVIKGNQIIADSCGCHCEKHKSKTQIIMDLSEEKIYTENNLEILKATTIDFTNLNSFSEFSMMLQKYVEQHGFEYFYLCINGNREKYYSEIDILSSGKDLDRDTKKYMNTMSIPLAYERGVWNSYREFTATKILPEECMMRRDGEYYLVMPIHYGNYSIGYCVVGNSNKKLKQRFLPHLVVAMNNALGNIREKDVMASMFARINKKWIYDDLTGIYNRAGLWQKAEKYVATAKEKGRKIAVFFIDLDGLKRINDEFGHDEGDRYIKSMADILVQCNEKNDVVARYGGDEYIVLTSYCFEEEIQQVISRTLDAIEQFNKTDVAHKLSASIGYQKEDNNSDIDVRSMIALADHEMYTNKRLKKSMNRDIIGI